MIFTYSTSRNQFEIKKSLDRNACVFEFFFIPVTRLTCSYGKSSNPVTEISVTGTAHLLIGTHRNVYKARSRKPSQPGQPGSYEKALSYVINKIIADQTFTI